MCAHAHPESEARLRLGAGEALRVFDALVLSEPYF